MIRADYIIVGSGLTGAVIARALADDKQSVLVLERRNHLGGNVHDTPYPCGIKVHTYGPHYFRTSSEKVWKWANRFGPFERYEARVLTQVHGELQQWPVSAEYISKTVGKDWEPAFHGKPTNLEEAALAIMPEAIYSLFVKEYNEKQWGRSAKELSPSLCKRFSVRTEGENRLTPNAKYQGIPLFGYTDWTCRMFDGIPVVLNYDYLQNRSEVNARKLLIYTGPIDEYFGFDLGKLEYRGQIREHHAHPDAVYLQPCGQVNNPLHSGGEHIRTLEWKHMMPSSWAMRIKGSIWTTETPYSPTDPNCYEYPVPDLANESLFKLYQQRAKAIPGVLFAGRLGEYKYYDMDHAILRAMNHAENIRKAEV
jgi:UDP-galactopyranose mutase